MKRRHPAPSFPCHHCGGGGWYGGRKSFERPRFATAPQWRPHAFDRATGPPGPRYVVVWRTPVMQAPAFWYFAGTPAGLRQAWAAKRGLDRRWVREGESRLPFEGGPEGISEHPRKNELLPP